MIRVENLTKTFKVHQKEPGLAGSVRSMFSRKWVERTALKNVSLSIEAGEIVGMVGANGAGKTTLVKALAGIIHPTSGSASVLGFTPWERKNDFKQQISLIMGQKAQLWWDLPAADSFILLREIYQIPKARCAATIDFLSKTLDVAHILKIPVRKLSLGERMKMELLAALLHQPKVVYLDEPTIGLDISAQRAVRKFILEYRAEHNPAMILTSHYMEDIEQLCKRIVIIREGEIVYDGDLARIQREYAASKIVTINIAADTDMTSVNVKDILAGNAEIIEYSAATLKFKADRKAIGPLTARLLAAMTVADVTIEDEDIGTIIEHLMKRKGSYQ